MSRGFAALVALTVAATTALPLAIAQAPDAGVHPAPETHNQPQPTEPKAVARTHFDAAERAFAAGHFTEALADYQAGYRAAPLPGFLINIAHCYRLSGDLHRARAYYRKYILVEPTSSRRKEVEDMITELDRAIAEVESAAPAAHTSAAHTGPRPPPSPDFWLWSAIATSIVGPTAARLGQAE